MTLRDQKKIAKHRIYKVFSIFYSSRSEHSGKYIWKKKILCFTVPCSAPSPMARRRTSRRSFVHSAPHIISKQNETKRDLYKLSDFSSDICWKCNATKKKEKYIAFFFPPRTKFIIYSTTNEAYPQFESYFTVVLWQTQSQWQHQNITNKS